MQLDKSYPIPLTIIGGFLGSGKTSLLNHILTQSTGKRVAVLVNDFGAINVDAKLIVSIEGETVSLANGCVCCTIRDDLLTEVLKLLGNETPPEHIVIETSGVSKPLSVAETFINPAVQGLVDLQNMISVLDADLVVDKDAKFGDLAFDQIAFADLVIINKTDLISPARLTELKRRVETFVPRARVWETTFGVVPLELIFDDQSSAVICKVPHEPGHGHSDDHQHSNQFDAWSYCSDLPWTFNALQRAIENLPTDIYRAKGIVRLDLPTNDYGILQLTGRRAWLRLREPEDGKGDTVSTELVFIGIPGATTNEALKSHLEGSLQAAKNPNGETHIITDLRAFNVIFS